MNRSVLRRCAATLTAAAALAAVAACGDLPERETHTGTVTYLEHEPYESWTECGYRFGYDGTYKHECWTEYNWECYYVEFEDAAGHTYTDCTDEDRWKALAVGDTYTDG